MWDASDSRPRHGEYKAPGGKLTVVDFTVRDGKLVDVQISGDFFLYPDEALTRLAAALEGVAADLSIELLILRLQAALAADEMLGSSPAAIAEAVRRGLA